VQFIFFPSWWFLEYRRFIGNTYTFWYLWWPQVTLLFKKVYIIQWVRGLSYDSGGVGVAGSNPAVPTNFIIKINILDSLHTARLSGV
jgi:hypothetical protein